MGAEQSSGRDANSQASDALKRCYYEVLGVERSATDDEYREASELLRTMGVQVPSFRPVYARLLWLITAVASNKKPKTMGASA